MRRNVRRKDWELARVALGCHVALDMMCQEMHEAWSSGNASETAFRIVYNFGGSEGGDCFLL